MYLFIYVARTHTTTPLRSGDVKIWACSQADNVMKDLPGWI
jgi:hypothetical protein